MSSVEVLIVEDDILSMGFMEAHIEKLGHNIHQAEELAVFIAHLYPDPQQVLGGVVELLVNAIEHGNLGVGYERKTTLIDSGQWQEEINRLARLPENRHKFAKAVFERKDDAISLTISDCGPGFIGNDIWRLILIASRTITVEGSRRAIFYLLTACNTMKPEIRLRPITHSMMKPWRM